MQKAIAILCVLILPGSATYAIAQTPLPPPEPEQQQQPSPPPQPAQQQAPLLSPQQLDNLVAPIALYPDPLLAQVLAASTYPLEIVEAQQWLQQNRNLRGQQLIDAARQQNWDPSVQALVAFPDAMAMLTRDIQWTTDLGNAFLAQQADVMNAIQTMRAQAQQRGMLQSNQQETVTAQPMDNGQPAIQIQPANPQVIYVPVYNPVYVWGPPVWGAYPPLWYPAIGYGVGFGAGVFLSGLFAGFLGFGGWGWGLNWLAHGLFLNTLFFHHFGFAGFGPGFHGYGGSVAWVHNPAHRLGVAYPNRMVASRFGAAAGRYNAFNGARYNTRNFESARGFNGSARGFDSARSFNNSAGGFNNETRGFNGARNFSGNYNARSFAPRSYNNEARNNFSNSGASRYSAPRGNERAPSQHFPSQHYSAPRSSGGGHFSSHSGGHSSGHSGHSGGGHSRGKR